MMGARLGRVRDQAESTAIEIIDSDPSAFGVDCVAAPAPAGRVVRPRWAIITAVGSVVVVVAASVLVWRPWQHDPDTAWSNRLLVEGPLSSVVEVAIDEPWIAPSSGEVGFVFAEPGAVLPRLRSGEGRSAVWQASAVDSMNAWSWSMSGDTPTLEVQGVPARVDGVDGSAVRVSFGPLDGRIFEVSTNALTKEEAVSFAGAIAVERGRPVLRDESVLLGMEPVGTYDEFNGALALLNLASGPTTATHTSVQLVGPQGGTVAISSTPDPGDGRLLTMAQLVLGGDATGGVHERPTLTRDLRPTTDDDQQVRGSMVVWHERGRFVVVTGSGSVDETLALAETTHEVTEEAWAPVAEQAQASDFHYPAFVGFHTTGDGSITAVSASTDSLGGLSLCLDDQVGSGDDGCVSDRDTQLPMLTFVSIRDLTFIFAMVSPDASLPELLVTRADGSVRVHPLFRPSGSVPGPAVAVSLPDDFQGAALLIDGDTVATL